MAPMAERVFKLHDSMSRKVKALATSEPGHLRFYTCGPTVYSYAHIGNFRSFLNAELVVRTAKALGWDVTWVVNITDVGHLTDDDVADSTGEDKMERALRSKEGESFNNVWELAEFYTDAFERDWKNLNLLEPTVRPKATQHVREQIVAASELIEKGFAYETPTGVYFNVEKFPDYGKLSGNTRDKLRDAVRDVVLDENKRDQADFAIWKKDDRHLMQWYSPFGWGFPGWHIECSVMARAYLGETIDLHSGGEDNRFPHHECEIAQSEALTGRPFANHWMHVSFLQVDGKKMSKSLGNWYTVRDLVEERGVDPLALRYALISVPYNKPFNFTLQTLEDSLRIIERYGECDRLVQAAVKADRPGEDSIGAALDDLYEEALSAMCEDLNTAVALAKGFEATKLILKDGASMSGTSARSAKDFLDKYNGLMGVVRHEAENRCSSAPKTSVDANWVATMIEERARAKREKDFARADAIRSELDEAGVELRDTPDGTTWKVKAAI